MDGVVGVELRAPKAGGLLSLGRAEVVPVGFARKMDCTLEMRQPRWAHFAGKGLQSEAEAILTEVPADGYRAHEEQRQHWGVGEGAGSNAAMSVQVVDQTGLPGARGGRTSAELA
jgi:hypothetical protein